MAIRDKIIRYRIPENPEKIPDTPEEIETLTLEYEDHRVSTTAFSNHNDILIKRPGKPQIDIPILRAEEFYIRGSELLARYKTGRDHRDICLGIIRDSLEDRALAEKWVEVANLKIQNG